MSTRYLIGVIFKGEYKVAQLGQWDGYIEGGAGEKVLDFLRAADLEVFKEKIKNCVFVTKEDLREMYVLVGNSPDNNSGITRQVTEAFEEAYHSITRYDGAEILEIIYNSTEKTPLFNNIDFFDDETFCEFAYIINLDNEKLLCYTDKKHKYGEYNISKLPTVSELQTAYENSGMY